MIFLAVLSFLCSCVLGAAVGTDIGSVNHARDGGDICYDAVIVGGGPAGLSALSGLARVRRNAILIDSGEYRNGPTRHVHDVIGLDGVTPAYFRWLARDKLAYYDTISMTNGTVTGIQPQATSGDPSYTVSVTFPSGEESVLIARSVVIATGLRDLVPNTPGLLENWGKGIYWCPWCDGHEHADQALGLMAPLNEIPGMVREILTLDTDLIAFVNGTDTPDQRSKADGKFPGWETYLQLNNVTVYNQTLTQLTRLSDGGSDSGHDPSAPTWPEHDLFRVDLDDGTSVERAAFFTSFPNEQRSNLGEALGVTVEYDRLAGIQINGYLTNIPMVYAVGDINIDNSTNVPHAMYSGKKSAVSLHIALAKQEAAARLAAAGEVVDETLMKRVEHELDPREIWDVMNGPRGDILYAGEFESRKY